MLYFIFCASVKAYNINKYGVLTYTYIKYII